MEDTPRLTGLHRLCRLYGRLRYCGVLYVWDYATDTAVPETAMPPGSARHAASERVRCTAWAEALRQWEQEEGTA